MTISLADISPMVLEDVMRHAEREAPSECCGLIVRVPAGDMLAGCLVYSAARNVAPTRTEQFRMDPDSYVWAEELGEIVAVVHSHPNASANPSMPDRVGCEKSGLPWFIVGWPSGVIKQLDPSGWQAPYKGREFCHGVLDCYSLIQDWYRRELAIPLPDFDREDGWWEKREGHEPQDLYMENFEKAGFVRVYGEPQRHDVFLIQYLSDRANHGAIYTGNGLMLHHLHGQLSEEIVYGHYYQHRTRALLRHISRVLPSQAQAVALAAAA